MSTERKADKHGLLSAPIPTVLRRLTVPMVFGMVAILMFNLVDTFFISLLGTEALAAVSFTFPVTFAINCITMGVSVGISTKIGRLLGSGDNHTAARFATHGLLLALVLMVTASGIGLLTLDPPVFPHWCFAGPAANHQTVYGYLVSGNSITGNTDGGQQCHPSHRGMPRRRQKS